MKGRSRLLFNLVPALQRSLEQRPMCITGSPCSTDTFSILTTAFTGTFLLQTISHSSYIISQDSFPCEPNGLVPPTFSSHQTGLAWPSRLGSTSTMPPTDSVKSTGTASKRGTTNSQHLQLRDV